MLKIAEYEDFLHSLSIDGVRNEINEWKSSPNKDKRIGLKLLKVMAEKLKERPHTFQMGFKYEAPENFQQLAESRLYQSFNRE